MAAKLESQLREFDGVAVTILSEARVSCRNLPGYWEDLAALCLDPTGKVADGATWILKAEAEEGVPIPPGIVGRIVNSLDDIHSWQAKLHLCQVIDKLPVDADQADRFLAWARTMADHPRPFLRAWVLHATVLLGLRFKKNRHALEHALDAGGRDKAASVRARARQLRTRVKQASLLGEGE